MRELEAKQSEIEHARSPVSAHGTIQYPNDQQITEALRTRYQCQKLDERRGNVCLVKLDFSSPLIGDIVCNLEAYAMSKLVGNYTYEAVSYVWDSPARLGKVLSGVSYCMSNR
jgi:hypothetical protein